MELQNHSPGLPLPDGITATEFAADSNESPSDGWRVPFFADGSTTGGGIEFQDGDLIYSLVIDSQTGNPSIQESKLPNLSLESWPAGGFQKRVS